MSSIENYYKRKLFENGFKEEKSNAPYNSVGKLYSIPLEIGKGVYWVYGQEDLYDIKIHDFYFYEDSIFDFEIQENNLSICYYESISGEEISPYKRLTAGCVKSFIGGYAPCKTIIHKNIPVRSIEIEITPSYYEKYLKEAYPNEYISLYDSFCNISLTSNFPEMISLFHQIWNYRGGGMAAKLFYDGKVAEAISLVIEHNKKHRPNLNVCYRRACGYILSYCINIQILQALCQIVVDGYGSLFNGFLRVAPRIVGLRKCLDEILHLVGINNTLLNDFFFMYRVHINGGKILIHPKADTGNQHQP